MFHYQKLETKNPMFAHACLKAVCDELGAASACAAFGDLQKDSAIAYKYYLKAAQKGDFAAMYNVGAFLIESNNLSDQENCLKWLLKVAEHADGEIAFEAMYLSAIVLKKNSKDPSDVEKIINLLADLGMFGLGTEGK